MKTLFKRKKIKGAKIELLILKQVHEINEISDNYHVLLWRIARKLGVAPAVERVIARIMAPIKARLRKKPESIGNV